MDFALVSASPAAQVGALGVIHVHPEERAFRDLCAEIGRDTYSIVSLRECAPYFQRALDSIQAHPENRQQYVSVFQDMVHTDTAANRVGSHYLLDYCMHTLRWPEVAEKIQERMKDAWLHNSEGESLVKILSYYLAA